MANISQRGIYLDGENIPRNQVLEIFRHPPEVPSHFDRSSLVVGSHGSGKTMLFRYLKEKHQGISIHIRTIDLFMVIGRQSGSGALEFDYSEDKIRQITNKSTSLIALYIAQKLFQKDIPIKREDFALCFPEEYKIDSGRKIDDDFFETTRRSLSQLSLPSFESISSSRPLSNFVSALGERVLSNTGRHLLLFYDKTDSVPAPSLIPLIETLDQSSNYVALLGIRPGHGTKVLDEICIIARPGDHYGIIDLGQLPRSEAWKSFVISAIEAQIGQLEKLGLSKEEIEAIVITSRDSPRLGLEICQALDFANPQRDVSVPAALKSVCENALITAEDSLRRWRNNFRTFAEDIRKEASIIGNGKILLPVILNIRQKDKELFPEFTNVDRLCAAALRIGAIHMPENDRWTPLSKPRTVELSPFLMWHKDNPLWLGCVGKEATNINKSEHELFKGTFPTSYPKIFIGYRMKFPISAQFRMRLEQALKSHPNLSHCDVTDGNVPVGEDWAAVIRKRLETSALMVADVTGPRGDILFEMGFARGLRKYALPVVEKRRMQSEIPAWLMAKQFGSYEDEIGIQQILASINVFLTRKNDMGRLSKLPDGIPSTAIWIGNKKWAKEASKQFQSIAEQEGFMISNIDNSISFEDVQKSCATSSLICIALDGSSDDYKAFYLAGTAVACESIGYGRKLLRRILVLYNGDATVIPDSLKNSPIVKIVTQERIKTEIQLYNKVVQDWMRHAPKRRGKKT